MKILSREYVLDHKGESHISLNYSKYLSSLRSVRFRSPTNLSFNSNFAHWVSPKTKFLSLHNRNNVHVCYVGMKI